MQKVRQNMGGIHRKRAQSKLLTVGEGKDQKWGSVVAICWGQDPIIHPQEYSIIHIDKNVWNQGTLINKEPYIEEIDYLNQEYKKFLNDFQK